MHWRRNLTVSSPQMTFQYLDETARQAPHALSRSPKQFGYEGQIERPPLSFSDAVIANESEEVPHRIGSWQCARYVSSGISLIFCSKLLPVISVVKKRNREEGPTCKRETGLEQ